VHAKEPLLNAEGEDRQWDVELWIEGLEHMEKCPQRMRKNERIFIDEEVIVIANEWIKNDMEKRKYGQRYEQENAFGTGEVHTAVL
jgi:integrase